MDINTWLIRHYLDFVTAGWFDVHDLPPDSIDEYVPYIEEMRKAATTHNELEPLRLGFLYLLSHPEIDISPLGQTRYPFSDPEVREIIQLICKVIGPDSEANDSDEVSQVRLIETSLSDWRSSR